MTIVRVGLSEHEKFAQGWEAIFGKKKKARAQARPASASRKKAANKKAGKGQARKK